MERFKEKRKGDGAEKERDNAGRERILARPAEKADRWRIGLTGLTPGAGVSFLTACLAGYLAEKEGRTPAVAELGDGGLYDSLGMERRFIYREYRSFLRAATGSVNLHSLSNMEEGVNWALKTPAEQSERPGYREALRLIYGISGDAVLFDFSGRNDEEGWLLLKEMDVILGVVDPMPARLLAGRSTLERWKLSGLPVRILVNKDNRGVDRKELQRFLKIRGPETIPYLDPRYLYSVQYRGGMPWGEPEIRRQLEPAFHRLFSGLCGGL